MGAGIHGVALSGKADGQGIIDRMRRAPRINGNSQEAAMAHVLSKVLTLAAGAGLSGTTAVAEGSYRGYEAPRYAVEQQLGERIEVRSYAPHLLAEVQVSGDRNTALSRGFQVLAGYIFGGNTGGSTVAMTSPVTQRQGQTIAMTSPVSQQEADGVWAVTFMMPGSYTVDTLPTPNSNAIRFYMAPAERHVVLTFSGWARDATVMVREAELRTAAGEAGLTLTGGPIFHYYDDPFTAPWRRRNEVAFVIE
jgi:hypothetical protein